MTLSRAFIARPVATTLLTAAIAIAGAIGFRALPVSPLPEVDFPTISVQANLPGASPETMAATVATPLERNLGSIAGVAEMTSSSWFGSTRIVLQFGLDRDIDGAARDVQAAIHAARALLPAGLPINPTYHKVNPANAPVMILSLTSESLPRERMYDLASSILAQRIAQVDGVGEVDINGAALPAVRVDVDLGKLNRMGLTLEAVRTAIAAGNVNGPKGFIESGDRSLAVGANDQAKAAGDFRPIVVAWRNGSPVRLSDIADVRDSVENIRHAGETNGTPSVLIIIRRQPGANILETVDRIEALLPELRASIPASVDLNVDMERTATIRASLREAGRSLALAVGLVVLVAFLFLRDTRAMWIPAVAVPVSLVGSFAAMKLLGFSLNNLTLMALTIATGFVVDDAVVVLENVVRHIEAGEPPMRAALRGSREVGFTVLSMSLSLVAVFLPILAMGGLVGRLFREFAATLSLAIGISLAISLTTTPMMCAWLLRGREPDRVRNGGSAAHRMPLRVRLAALRDAAGRRVLRGYERTLDIALGHPRTMLAILAATIALNAALYAAVPKGFFPAQETGLLIGSVQADQSTSFQAMERKLNRFMAILRADPAVRNVNGFTGGRQTNAGFLFVILKPLGEPGSARSDAVIARLRPRLARVAGARLYLQPAQDLRAGAREANAQYQYTLRSDDLAALRAWEPRIKAAMAQLPELADVSTDAQDKGLATELDIDRDTASRMNRTMRQIDSALGDAYGQRQVSTIYEPLAQYHVVEEAMPRYWQDPEALRDFMLTSPAGTPIPLRTLARWHVANMPLTVNHQGLFAADTLSFNLAPGIPLGEAAAAIERAMLRIGAPAAIHGSFQGTAKVFEESLSSEPLLVLLALFSIYIVLGVLYESTVHPLTILSTLPSAGVGAVVALMIFRTPLTVVSFIGVILLIGIVKKNAIMMIDVAIDLERRERLDSREAIRRACLLRLRPILMTTATAMLGAVPLALSSGPGAELRRPLGIAILGGLILSQLLTLYTTPVMYLALDRLRLRLARRFGTLRRASDEPAEPLPS